MKKLKVLMVMVMILTMAAGAVWAGGGGDKAKSGDVTIRFSWWGANERNARMNQLLDIFETQHPGIKISREYSSWGDYWTKFTTQAAAGTHPDVSLHVMQSVQEYVNKGVLIPLDEYVASGKINVKDWSGTAISPGRINGKQYGIIYGLVAQGVLYNSKLISDAGMAAPRDDWTYAEFKQYCLDLKKKLPAGVFASEGPAASDHAVEIFMRSRGKSLYNAQGNGLGFDKEDLIEWWTLWEDLRKAECVPGPILAAELANAPYEQTLFGSNRAAMIWQNGNLIPTFQKLTSGEVFIVREPRSKLPGDFFQPTMFGISSKTKLVNESVIFIDWMVNELEPNLIFKAEYGVPGDPDVIKALEDMASPVEKKNYQFSSRIFADSAVPPSSARAEGSAAVFDPIMRMVYEDISTEVITIRAGVDRFFTEASAQLARNKPNS
ncbi:lipoprotein [Spirochaetia bacterium]|nr:lipoprotein [Spirochaetia bacterium]